MLLEDKTDTCIRCGANVSLAENISLYPPGVMETMDAQKEEKKKYMRTIALIIGISVLLVAVIAVAAVGISKGGFTIGTNNQTIDEVVEESFEELEEEEIVADEATEDIEATEEPIQEVEVAAEEDEPITPSGKDVKDASGLYYNYKEGVDEAGNVLFRAVYPEDLTTDTFTPNYERYMDTYPVGMTFIAANTEGTLNFKYVSPQKLWYKNSETGKSKADLRDPNYYMTYYEYGGAKGYIEATIEASYPKAKYELISEKEVSQAEQEAVEQICKDKSKALFKDLGDYAHIGSDTTYANMDSDCSAYIYEYEITTTDKEVMFDKFYVPVMANNLYYASEAENDRGTVTEWYLFGFAVMEAGNEDIYEEYEKDFDLFVANAIPTRTYFDICQQYTDEIRVSIENLRAVDPLTKEMLKEYGDESAKGMKLNEFNAKVMNMLAKAGTGKYTGNGITLYTAGDLKSAYVDRKGNKAFFSTDLTDYPGDNYIELLADDSEETFDDTISQNTDSEDKKEDEGGARNRGASKGTSKER